MKFYAILFLLSFFVFACSFQIHSQGAPSRVAVINGIDDKENGGTFCDLLFTELLKDTSIELVEREAVDKILREQSISGSSNSGTLIKAGKVFRADLLIVLLNDGEKAKLCFFDVNHGLRVASCPVDVKNSPKSKDVKASLKKAIVFISGKGKPVYSIPPFANNDILYQNDKYQGILAEKLRDELFSKGALLIEFDEALRIVGEFNISEGSSEITPLPLTLISGEFTQNQKDKNSLDLKLSKIQLNDNTASIFSGKINVNNQRELKSAIVKIASSLLKNSKKPVALDIKKQLSILLKKARDHMSAEAFEQARIEAATAIMMDSSNVEARIIFCSSIVENLKTNKYRQDDPEYFHKLCLQFLDQFEWVAMNGKAGYKFSYYYIVKAAQERLAPESFNEFILALQNIAARGMKYDYGLCSLYSEALSVEPVDKSTGLCISGCGKAKKLADVIVANRAYTNAFPMANWVFGNCHAEGAPFYAEFYYILLNRADLPYSLRKAMGASLTDLNERRKKANGGIWYSVPQIEAPKEDLGKYFQEASVLSGSDLSAASDALESLDLVKDYNGIRLKLESIRKSGKELDKDQNRMLGEAYGNCLYEILGANADPVEKRKLYRIYSERCISLVEETYKKRQQEPNIAVLNDKGFQTLVFSDPKDEALIADYGKMIDSVRRLTEDIMKHIASIRAEKRCFTDDEKYLFTYEGRLWVIYFNSFAELPVDELVKAHDRIGSPGTPLWTASVRASFYYLLANQQQKLARNLVEFLAGSDKYKEASSEFLMSLARDFKREDFAKVNEDFKAIVALLPVPSAEDERKIEVKEVSLGFSQRCESLKKEPLRDVIQCGKSRDAMLYDRQILFPDAQGKLEKLIKDNDNVEYVSDAAWDGKYLWYAIINKNESEQKGCSRGEIICWDPATGRKKKWDSKKGVVLEFLKESEKWKAERKKDMELRHMATRGSYSVIQLFPCEGKVFVFTSFYDPLDFKSSHIGRRVWIGVIENAKDLKIFYREKVGTESPFYSKIKFFGKPVSCRDKILRYYGNRMTMSINTSSLKVSFKEYRTIGWIFFDSERCRAIDDYVFFEYDGLWATVPSLDELTNKVKISCDDSSPQLSRSNFFKYKDKLYLQVAGDGLYNMKSPVEKPELVIDYKTFTPVFDDLFVSSHYGILGVKDGKFYTVTLP